MPHKSESASVSAMRTHFSQVAIWVLLAIGYRYSYRKLPVELAEPDNIASIISFLPDALLRDPAFFGWARLSFLIGGVCWAVHILTPFTSWLTAISFTLVVSLFYENSSKIAHTFNLTALLLIIHAAWYFFRRREIAEALRDGTFRRRTMYPIWVFKLSVFTIAFFHVFAGLSKVYFSGLDWANGISMQLWVNLWGLDSWSSELILSDRRIAQGLQWATLAIEIGALVALFSKHLRFLVGLCVLGLYIGILCTFDFAFQFNALIVILFFLPTYEVLDWAYRFIEQHFRITITPKNTVVRRLVTALCVRFDVLGLVIIADDDSSPPS